MKFPLFFAIASLCVPLTASAEESPSAPSAPLAPSSPALAQEDKPVARKPEEDEAPAAESDNTAARKNWFQSLFSKQEKPAAAARGADETSELRAHVDSLTKRNAALEQQVQEQAKQLAYIDDNWPAIQAALVKGDDAAPVLQTPTGQRLAAAVAAGTAAAITAAGHEPTALPGPGAQKPAGASEANTLTADNVPIPGSPEFKAISADYWRNRPQQAAPSRN